MKVVHLNKYRSKFTKEQPKIIRKKAAAKATFTNKLKKYADSAHSDNALQHTPVTKESPITIARNLLGDRLQEIIMCDGISWELDGKPTGLTQVMQAANRILVGMGKEQIKGNPAWVVHATS